MVQQHLLKPLALTTAEVDHAGADRGAQPPDQLTHPVGRDRRGDGMLLFVICD